MIFSLKNRHCPPIFKHVVSIILFFTFSQNAYSLPDTLKDKIYNSNIKTVQFYNLGWDFSTPVLHIGSNEKLLLKFDDLSDEVKTYNYQIIHCNFDWTPSGLIDSEYLDGFPENQIYDYNQSINTTVSYVNYQIQIPNENVAPKISGNYALAVYEDYNIDNPILVKRFYVTEDRVNIRSQVRRGTFDTYPGVKQEIPFWIEHPDYPISDTHNDIRVVVRQNWRTDNALTELTPRFSKNDLLDYDYNQENNFMGGNEFRYFDLKTIRTAGENVHSISFHRPHYHATLKNDIPRSSKPYYFYQDINGHFLPYYQEDPESTDIEADYIFVHFTLKIPEELSGGIYVYGELSNWGTSEETKMKWIPEFKHYELTLLLKQGYYNFQYVYLPPNGTVADHAEIEGSHFDTENDYQIFVYHTDPRFRYDKLIAYRVVNTMKK